MTSLLTIINDYNFNPPDGKRWIAYDKDSKKWSRTNNKRLAVNLDQVFYGIAKELTNKTSLSNEELSNIKRFSENLKKKYDRSSGIYRKTFGLMNQYRAGLSYRFLNTTMDLLQYNRNGKYSVSSDLKGKVRLINRGESNTLMDQLFSHHPETRVLYVNPKDITPGMLVRISRNYPELTYIRMPDMNRVEANRYRNFTNSIKKSCKKFKGFTFGYKEYE